MENKTTPHDLEENPTKAQFQRDLATLRETYGKDTLSLVENNIDLLLKEYEAWQKSLTLVAKNLGLNVGDANEIPTAIEQFTLSKVKKLLSQEKPTKIVLGISGPGAVGKETIKTALGFDTVVNTTTRAKRDYEKEGEHYNFLSDIEFEDIRLKGGFVISMERSGRGKYGITKNNIEVVLLRSKISIIEENPANLTQLSEYIMAHTSSQFVIIYILPPSPVLPHLAARLAGRCQKTGEDFKSSIASTLGTRQLDEFLSILEPIRKGVNVVFVLNDKVERVIGEIKDLINTPTS